MSHTAGTLYPTLIAVIDLTIGGGFLYMRGLSPFGMLMTAIGVILLSHVVYSVVRGTERTVHDAART